MSSYGKHLAFAALAGAIWTVSAVAVSNEPIRVESGAVSDGEIAALNERANDYSLKIVWAAKRSGAYLADVDVKIVALPQRDVILEHRTQGPLMLVDLPPGRYEVTGSYPDVLPGTPRTQSKTFVVPDKGLVQGVMYFDTGD